ncbi:MAG: ATP-binding protein [Clostridia bacterium]|nr:ATP-binding protein [Clostridia bacterium]
MQIFLLTLVCISILFVYGIIAVKSNSKTIIKERLKEETKLACSLIKSTDDFDCFSDYYNDNALRITVIDLEGNVLFESDTKAPLENHIDREEIRNAIKNTPQAVERYSDTFGCEMTYYALKTELDDGTKVILRMALKSSHINGYFIITLPILFMVLCISLGFSIVFSDVISKKVTSKITDVGKSLRSLNDGNYAPIKTSSDEPELYSVLNEINELNSSIHKHIRRETEERNKLDTVLENVYQGILAIGRNKKIIFANKSVMKLFGCAEEPSGNDVVFLIDDLALCNLISEHLGEDFGGEYLYKGKELSVVIKNADGAEAGNECSIVIFTDVTKEKEMAKQKNDFFANASHELKTPVAVMQGLSELLLAKNLDESSEKQVERIHKESLRLSSLITDMLELSRLENGGQSEMILSKVNLKETAEEALGELSAKMAEKGVTATVTGNGTIDGDAKKIYELVENLCGNAVNYNKENGKIAVDITESGDNVILKVSDTGIGIEKENIPRLCERFYRVDKSRSKKTGGTGLGLAIVKHICALHNATLSIDSDIGLGTSVTVTFNKSNR